MASFFGVIGMMTLCWILQDALSVFTKKLDNMNGQPSMILLYPLSFIMYLLMTCSAPIGLFMMWHDNRRERIYRITFYEEQEPLKKSTENYIRRLEIECKRLERRNDELYAQLSNKRNQNCKEEHHGSTVDSSSEEVYYMEARNGMTVRVPASKLDAWQAAQQKEGPVELTPQEQRFVEKMVERIYGK